MSPKKETEWRKPGFNPDKTIQYIHNPTQSDFGKGITCKITRNGKVTITVAINDDSFDEVEVPASVVYKIAIMLDASRTTKLIDKEDLQKELENN